MSLHSILLYIIAARSGINCYLLLHCIPLSLSLCPLPLSLLHLDPFGGEREEEEWFWKLIQSIRFYRNAEKEFVAETDAIEPGTEWERIAKLCDFNPKASKTSRDVSRMRSIILQLKNPVRA